ncbi:dsDNA nuclease domain-containing protein [Teredinibacter franksiae]|uniref:dsDNA nuclease domain-containing protein n=1 Tax=Teredinibacter franksiae TaxID=2761453 RepID=UPI001629ACDE|nr:dsDNA nuclease domain-containing protein [Teredinibacter franksiae]
MFHNLRPREQGGRTALERFDCQIKSGVIACLEILNEDEVQKVYCEFHDDIVVQRKLNSESTYDFIQVKTQEDIREPFGLNKLFGINTQKGGSLTTKNLHDSFAGKLLQHVIQFGKECNSVVFQTNIVVDKKVEELRASLDKGEVDNKWVQLLFSKYNGAFSGDGSEFTQKEIIEHFNKLHIQEDVPYLKLGNSTYHSEAHSRIYEYSEIDLRYIEAREIIIKLEDLVFRKSKGPLKEFSYKEIEEKTSIGITDLLNVLAISRDAYLALKSGGDAKAIRNASIIQRTLESAGVSQDSITYCSQCKIEWDVWVRESCLDFLDVEGIAGIVEIELNKIITIDHKLKLMDLRKAVKLSMIELEKEKILFDLNKDQVLGAFFSQIVKLKS